MEPTQPLTSAAARKARELAEQRLALAHDAKVSAENHLVRMRVSGNTSPHVLAAAEADHVRAVQLYREAVKAADQASRIERDLKAGARR